MNTNDYIGFAGVTILLVAFVLNLSGRILQTDITYILLNIFGAAIACLASVLIHYTPFVILEGSWTLASVWGVLTYLKNKKHS